MTCCCHIHAGPALGHTSTVWGVAFNSDGSRMVSCSDDLSLHIWSCPISSGKLRTQHACLLMVFKLCARDA